MRARVYELLPGAGLGVITEDDLFRAAAYVNLPVAEFEAKYVVRHEEHFASAKAAGGAVPLSREITAARFTPLSRCNAGCSHSGRNWLKTGNWDEAGKNCPGIGGGPLIQIGRAMEVASEMRTAYPSHYEWK